MYLWSFATVLTHWTCHLISSEKCQYYWRTFFASITIVSSISSVKIKLWLIYTDKRHYFTCDVASCYMYISHYGRCSLELLSIRYVASSTLLLHKPGANSTKLIWLKSRLWNTIFRHILGDTYMLITIFVHLISINSKKRCNKFSVSNFKHYTEWI